MKSIPHFFLSLLVVFTAAAFAQSPPPPPRPAQGAAQSVPLPWQTFASERGNFSVSMPGKPEESVQQADSPLGKLQLHFHIAASGPVTYTMLYTDYPIVFDTQESAEASFNGSRDTFLAQSGGTLVVEKSIFFGKFPGREWRAKTAMGVTWTRQYLVQQRLYAMMAFLPEQLHAKLPESNEITRFFDSFKLLKDPGEIPPNLGAASNVDKAARTMELPPDFNTRPIAWREFSNAGLGFRISMPSEPVEQTAALNPSDPRLNIKFWIARGEGFICQVIAQPLLESPGDELTRNLMLKGMVEPIANESRMKVVSEEPIDLQGHPGRGYKLQNASLAGTGKVYLVGKTIYFLLLVTPDNKAKPEDVTRFFDSFSLIDAPAPPAPASTAWTEFVSKETNFSVLLPTKPALTESPNPAGGMDWLYTVLKFEISYMVRVSYVPDLLKMRGKPDELFDAIARNEVKSVSGTLLGEAPLTLQGFPGRELRFKTALGQIAIDRMYLVGSLLYRVDVLVSENKVDAPEVKRFFDSFKLLQARKDFVPPPPPPAPGFQPPPAAPMEISPKDFEGEPPAGTIRVSNGVLQASATKKVSPEYPPIAKAAGAKGGVRVRVMISEEGKVIDAEVVSGHPLLRDSSLQAAWQWRFTPMNSTGQPLKVQGILIFNFSLPDKK